MTSFFSTVWPASLYSSATMPLIWAFTFTSSRGWILPVTTVDLEMVPISGASSSYWISFGRERWNRYAKVPMNTAATRRMVRILPNFFI